MTIAITRFSSRSGQVNVHTFFNFGVMSIMLRLPCRLLKLSNLGYTSVPEILLCYTGLGRQKV